MLLGTPSCLITSTTEFPSAVASRPFIHADSAFAFFGLPDDVKVPITKLLRVGSDDTRQVVLQAQVQAEDAGRRLLARAYVNYEGDKHDSFGEEGDDLEPSVFETVRTIEAKYELQKLPEGDGCYQIALVVTHQFNNKNGRPERPDDTEFVVWWMVRGDPSNVTLAQCHSMPALPELDRGAAGGDR
jgi:hypothetical protein